MSASAPPAPALRRPLGAPRRAVVRFGRSASAALSVLGRATLATRHMRSRDFVEQLGRIALSALPLVGIAALFAGMVIALQTSVQLSRLGMNSIVPDIVSVSLVRELGPVFTALLMAGKAGAGLASELGMVTLSGQAQAMRALGLDIDRELLAPRLWGIVIGTFLLTVAAIILGLLGGMLLSSGKLGLSPVSYMNRVAFALAPIDLAVGLFKSLGFGIIIAAFGLRLGLAPKADAAALGRDTMRAVVGASFVVLVADHILTVLISAVLE